MITAADIAERLSSVRENISDACNQVGRQPSEITIVGVSKTKSIETIRESMEAGLVDFGENRAQELIPKVSASISKSDEVPIPRWHFIGHLQRNKVRQVLPHISVLHSLDSTRLVDEIERHGDLRSGPALPCYLEVNVSGEQSKQGISPDELPELLRSTEHVHHIRVLGLMTIAPSVDDPEEVRPVFRLLRNLAEAHGLKGLSMGMTDDYTIAIEEGATVVRIGRAIFGARDE